MLNWTGPGFNQTNGSISTNKTVKCFGLDADVFFSPCVKLPDGSWTDVDEATALEWAQGFRGPACCRLADRSIEVRYGSHRWKPERAVKRSLLPLPRSPPFHPHPNPGILDHV